jgi:hypothetical protein
MKKFVGAGAVIISMTGFGSAASLHDLVEY